MADLPAWPSAEHAGESTTNVPLIQNPQRGEAKNWWKRILSVFEAPAGRREVLTTDAELQTGKAPFRIPHTLMLSRGLTGPHQNGGLPYEGSWAYIPALPLKRSAGKAAIPARMSDDSVTVPAIYAGNPPRG